MAELQSLASIGGLRLATVTAITACRALKIDREEMVRVMHEEHTFSDLFLKFLLARSMRTQTSPVGKESGAADKAMRKCQRQRETKVVHPEVSRR